MWLGEGGVSCFPSVISAAQAGRQEALSHTRGAIGKTTEFRVKAAGGPGEVTADPTEGTWTWTTTRTCHGYTCFSMWRLPMSERPV